VSVRLIYVLMVRVFEWLVLLGRSEALRTPRFWRCDERWPCCDVSSRGRSYRGQIRRCSLHSPGCCYGVAGVSAREASGAIRLASSAGRRALDLPEHAWASTDRRGEIP
jgi:hypothetical protein